MKTINKNFLLILFISLIACSKKENNIAYNKEYNNYDTYPQLQKDSAKAIESITKLKLQQVLDLSVLYSKNNRDKEINSALYNQILGYFYEPDSTTISPLINELDSLKVNKATIAEFKNKAKVSNQDTLNLVNFKLNYYDRNGVKISEVEHEMQYILVSAPIQFKKEFKFYFLNYFPKPLNDSTLIGVTK